MPRRVVPMRLLPRRLSLAPSRSRWYGMMMCAFMEMRRRSQPMPSSASMAISSSRTLGSTTQPLPMTGVTLSYMTPEGMRCSARWCFGVMTVWPALLPPWKRATKS